MIVEMAEWSSEPKLPSSGDEALSRKKTLEHSLAGWYPAEYLEGIEHFNAQRYFDAHEVWEEIWLHSSGDAKVFYQMLIQAAVGLHHYERGNARGTRGMYANVTEKLQRLPSCFMSLDLVDFLRQFKTFLAELIENQNEAAPGPDRPRPMIRLVEDEPVD